jgi:hypothetical protein
MSGITDRKNERCNVSHRALARGQGVQLRALWAYLVYQLGHQYLKAGESRLFRPEGLNS